MKRVGIQTYDYELYCGECWQVGGHPGCSIVTEQDEEANEACCNCGNVLKAVEFVGEAAN